MLNSVERGKVKTRERKDVHLVPGIILISLDSGPIKIRERKNGPGVVATPPVRSHRLGSPRC